MDKTPSSYASFFKIQVFKNQHHPLLQLFDTDIHRFLRRPDKASFAAMYNSGAGESVFQTPKFLVFGHRGRGMNSSQPFDPRMKALKENSILSFKAAAKLPIDFIEFDVQVTRDGVPVIFHDNFIVCEENGAVSERRVTELSLSEFQAYGRKPLLRKSKDGAITTWNVQQDDSLCTLQDVFTYIAHPDLGFNIELKFDDQVSYMKNHLLQVLQSIFTVVFANAGDRRIIFSSFHPDVALLAKKLQSRFLFLFLTNGGAEISRDPRRNSLEEAVGVCREGGLDGIVSECRAVLRNPGAVETILKESGLSLLTYGRLNNVPEVVYIQQLMGVDGVIVDLVECITDAVDSWKC